MDFSALARLYPDALVRAGRTYPVVVRPFRAAPAGFVDLCDDRVELDVQLRRGGDTHLAGMLAERTLFDGAVLCWRDGEQRFLASRGGYFDVTATCDALRAEFLTLAPTRTVRLADLPLRARAHAVAGDPLASGRGRAAGIGVSVLCTVPGRGGRAVLIGQRHARVVDSGLWHVAPAGNMESDPGTNGEHLAHTVAAELAEELGVPLSTAEVLRRGSVLGMCHDLLRLRPDVVVRLDLTEGESVDHLGAGQEYDRIREVPLTDLSDVWTGLPPDQLTAPGAGALALLELSLSGGDPVRPAPGF